VKLGAGERTARRLLTVDRQRTVRAKLPKNLRCSHALFAFDETVRYFMNDNSRVFGAFLDI